MPFFCRGNLTCFLAFIKSKIKVEFGVEPLMCIKLFIIVYKKVVMRTNIEINDKLMKKAQELSNIKTKKEVIEQALEHYVKALQRKDMLNIRGKINWTGNLEEMRKV